MPELYPLLLLPEFYERPWGARDLAPIYDKKVEAGGQPVGEAWLTGDRCCIAGGGLRGRTLGQLPKEFGAALVGEAAPDAKCFPLLIKFLFPREKLSVQVHPDDADARALGEPWGKTECWYVVHADPGAELGLGLKKGVSRAQFEKAIRENRAEEMLKWIKVFAGDMIYVAGGTVHTLGPGSIIVETQQQSDTTFRLYDYGRPRELHLDHGLRVIKETVASGKVRPQPFTKFGSNGNRRRPLVASRYFVVEQFEIDAGQEFDLQDLKTSAQILVATEGAATVEAAGCEPVTFKKGDAVVIPATINTFRIAPQGRVQFVKSYVPGKPLPDPETFSD